MQFKTQNDALANALIKRLTQGVKSILHTIDTPRAYDKDQ
jgi:hypothetical protein